MTAIFKLPNVLALDTNVAAEPLAELNFFEAGTSTPLDTFTDAALSIEHTNPVIADANGQFATIYLQARSYKVDLTTSSDTPGPAVSLPGYPVDNIDSSADADNITYTPPDPFFIGGMDRPTSSKFAESLSLGDFGAAGTDNDYTTEIDNAFATVVQRVEALSDTAGWNTLITAKLRAQAGRFGYNGTGFNPTGSNDPNIALFGDGMSQTEITLGASSRLFNFTTFTATAEVRDIYFTGGLGVYKESLATANVSMGPQFRNCFFSDHTEAAIAFGSVTDRPRVGVFHCGFTGSLTDNSINIMLPPGGGHLVDHCWFNGGNYDVKLFGTQLGEAMISNCRHGKLGAQTGGRHNFWIVPTTDATNAGRGIKIHNNMFGNENAAAGDIKILIADEGSGADPAVRQHVTTQSSGHLYGLSMLDNDFAGGAANDKALVVSHTTNFGEYEFRNYVLGTPPPQIFEMVYGFPGNNSRTTEAEIDIIVQNSAENGLPPVGYEIVIQNDKAFYLGRDQPDYFGAYQSEFSEILVARNGHSDLTLGSATKSQITDSLGGTSATEVTYTADSNVRYTLPLGNLNTGELMWIECDLAQGASNSLTDVVVIIQIGASAQKIKRRVTLTAGFTRIRFPFIAQQEASNYDLSFEPVGFDSGVKEKFKLGLPAAYHSKAPVNYGHVEAKDGTWDGAHLVLGNNHFWTDASDNFRGSLGAPTSDTDGAVIQLLT